MAEKIESQKSYRKRTVAAAYFVAASLIPTAFIIGEQTEKGKDKPSTGTVVMREAVVCGWGTSLLTEDTPNVEDPREAHLALAGGEQLQVFDPFRQVSSFRSPNRNDAPDDIVKAVFGGGNFRLALIGGQVAGVEPVLPQMTTEEIRNTCWPESAASTAQPATMPS
jgi:hypothetical protein